MSSNSPSKQGGILRSTKSKSKSTSTNSNGVSFSSSVQTSTFQTNKHDDTSRQEEYDSDDDDAILASGEGLVASRLTDTAASAGSDDDVLYSAAEIEQAKRRRDEARHNADLFDTSATTTINNDITSNSNNLSLITDGNANPDEYQSNAGSNASCPVEPFNMEAEREGGLGYFEGDTYVFRKNVKEGEEDAWLDGLDDEDENEESMSSMKNNVGGLDSMDIWKPKEEETSNNKGVGNNDNKRRANKYVNDDMTQAEMGTRLVSLLEADGETAMMALTRHGSTIRQLSSQEQKLKKSFVKKRKAKSSNNEPTGNYADDDISQLKTKIKEVREVVEELTELTDALLFKGETDAYELTREDWIHRFKLHGKKRIPVEELQDDGAVKKKPRHNYFADNDAKVSTHKIQTNVESQQQQQQQPQIVMWEYKGNEDGTIHGPYTTQQMLQWTTCGYFIGESAVDIRQVRNNSIDAEEKEVDVVDDLMTDLMDDEDESQSATMADNEWLRSDAIDFNTYL